MPGRTGSWGCRCAARVLRAARRARVPEGGSPPPTARSARPRPGCRRPSAARWSARHPRRSPPRRPSSTRVPHQPWRRRYRAPVSEGLARAPPTEASADVSTPNGNDRGALAEGLGDAREHGSRQHSLGLDGKGATEGVAPRGVELGKHVVKKEDRRLPGARAQPRPLRKLEREDGGPLFSSRGEGRQWPLADRHGEILTMRTHERRPLPAFAITLLDEQSAIALGAIISGRPCRLAGVRDVRDRVRAQRRGRLRAASSGANSVTSRRARSSFPWHASTTTRANDAPQRTISASSPARDDSPRATRCTASSRLVLPAPFGPTNAVTPGTNRQSSRS